MEKNWNSQALIQIRPDCFDSGRNDLLIINA
jgi:hypothetical protein